MNAARKVVFSRTLNTAEWANTTMAAGDTTEEIDKLRRDGDGHIVVWGGLGLWRSLMRLDSTSSAWTCTGQEDGALGAADLGHGLVGGVHGVGLGEPPQDGLGGSGPGADRGSVLDHLVERAEMRGVRRHRGGARPPDGLMPGILATAADS